MHKTQKNSEKGFCAFDHRTKGLGKISGFLKFTFQIGLWLHFKSNKKISFLKKFNIIFDFKKTSILETKF